MSIEKSFESRRMALIVALAVGIVGLGAASARGQTGTTLRWKFKEGEALHYSMEQTTVNTGLDPSGREVKGTIQLTTDMTWTTRAVDPSGTASMTQTIDRVRFSISSPGSKISSDSKEAGDVEGPFAPIFKILVGAEFLSKMNPKGELTEIKLSDKLLANLASANEGGGPKGQFSEEGLKNMLNQMVIPLPDGILAAGATWQRKLSIPTDIDGQTRQVEQIFTFKGPGAGFEGSDLIEFTTRMEPHKPDPRTPLVYKQETTDGRFDFDNKAGRIARSNSTEVVEVSMTLQGKEVPRKIETSRLLTLSKDKAP